MKTTSKSTTSQPNEATRNGWLWHSQSSDFSRTVNGQTYWMFSVGSKGITIKEQGFWGKEWPGFPTFHDAMVWFNRNLGRKPSK